MFDADAEKGLGRLFTEGSFRPQIGHAMRLFKRPARRHDFAPDVGDALGPERTLVGRLQFADDLGFTFGPVDLRAFLALDVTDSISQ